MSQAQGQFTIIDYNDALTLTGFIGTNKPKTQMYNPDTDTYSPSWSDSPYMVLTPSLYVLGSNNDVITSTAVQNVKWYDGNDTTAITNGGNYSLSGAKSQVLTIKANVLADLPGKDYVCVISYLDASTNLTLTYKMQISLSRVINGSGIADLVVTTPNGNVFKNAEVASLIAQADLWRGSTIDTDGVTYKWAIMDSSITNSSEGYDADFGTGWKKLNNTEGSYTGCNTNTLTVYASVVYSYAVAKCIAIDADGVKYQDTASFIDISDPLQVVITSTGGDIFKNGEGTSTLTAHVYRGSNEIDTAGNGTYTWTKYNKNSEVDTSWGTSGHKTGKTLSVGTDDVDVKATFLCSVEI